MDTMLTWMMTVVLQGGLLAAGPAPVPSAEQVADGIQRFYQHTRDFKAAFDQEFFSATLGRKRKSSGFVYVKKPGMMRWDYRQPRPKHFVADGKALYVYDPDLEQVMVDKSFSGSELSTAVTFLWGRGNLKEEFTIGLSDRKTDLPPNSLEISLVPRKKARFKKLWFVVDLKSFRVLQTTIADPGGNLNHISFSKMKINSGLKDTAFRFEIPKGIEVIEAKQESKRPYSSVP